MAYSMTGYGRCLTDNPFGRQQWEIRSTNGRFLDLKWHLPKLVKPLEYQLEKVVRRHVIRGRVEISLDLVLDKAFAPQLLLDEHMAGSMLKTISKFAEANDLKYSPDCNTFLQVPDLWVETRVDQTEAVLKNLESGLALALEDWNQSRLSEGEALTRDLFYRLQKMETWLGEIRDLAPVIVEERQNRLKSRIEELFSMENMDPVRVNQELVIIADKLDSTEEIIRLGVHLQRIRELLEKFEPDLGKRIDFTLQECFREINTCGNKLQSADLSKIVVDFKNELEKCREQAMNLE